MPRVVRSPQVRRSRTAPDGWDDEAWASQSDDDDFVARMATEPVTDARAPPVTAHGPTWMPLTHHASPPASPPHAPSVLAPAQEPIKKAPAPAAPADDTDRLVVHWAERSMQMGSPQIGMHDETHLEALLEDPMRLLGKEALCAAPPTEPAPLTEPVYATEDVAQTSISAWASAAAFDPLATMNDGVFMAAATPVPEPKRTRRLGSEPGVLRHHASSRTLRKQQLLHECLSSDDIDLAALRRLAWKGVPPQMRPLVWPLLLGYLPRSASIRTATLARKRSEYAASVERAFARGTDALDRAAWHQIRIDVPRTNPGLRLWQQAETQRALERILYIWAIRHPASGYVQGINDLATPFFEVFLSAYIDSDPETFELASLPQRVRAALEADTFWCLTKLLDGIQDNYIVAQPGIRRQLSIMGDVVARMDAPLHVHLAAQGVEYMQFSFRWMNCLLMREMSVKSIMRLWDTYLAEGADAFSDFHPFVCAVFLHRWRDELLAMDFQVVER
ncbi:GTPase-activating protein [Malassezia nana]|uniref:GTPase-activating protein n=1 Tax=Malassezia nana TaxID=180528 RepID=A0AAF0EU75_9BASI|nr:GTPase-activating protein [Malassezia nana]